jgi:hypothetical protein
VAHAIPSVLVTGTPSPKIAHQQGGYAAIVVRIGLAGPDRQRSVVTRQRLRGLALASTSPKLDNASAFVGCSFSAD